MDLKQHKITQEERDTLGVVALADRPEMPAGTLKERFDALVNKTADKFNEIVDDLQHVEDDYNAWAIAETGRADAEAVRVQNEDGRISAETGRVDAEAARVLAEIAREDEMTGSIAAAQAQADRAQTEADRAKAEADRAKAIVGSDYLTREEVYAEIAAAAAHEDIRAAAAAHNVAEDAHGAIDARIYKMLGKAVVNLTAIRADGAAYDNLLIGGISVDPSLRTTDAAGKLTLLLDAGSYTLSSSANGQYVDTIMPPVNIAIKAGDVKNITMTESYVNSDTHIFTITSSISKKFSRKVQSVDMCLVAGGGDGGDGGTPADGSGGEGGYGGLHGEVAYYERLPITPESQQSFIVGAPGGDTQGLGKTARGGTKGSNGNSGSSLGVRGGAGRRFISAWNEAEKRVYTDNGYTVFEFSDGYDGGVGNTKTAQTQSIMDGAITVSVEDGNGGCGGGAAGSFPVSEYQHMTKRGTRGTNGTSTNGGYGGNRCEADKSAQKYLGGAGGRGGHELNKAAGGGGNGSSCNEAASNGFNCTIDALKPQSYGSGGYGGGGAGGGFSKGVGGSGSKGKQGVIYLCVHYAA